MVDKDGNLVYDNYDLAIHRWMGDAEEPLLEQRGKRIAEDVDAMVRTLDEIRALTETTERS